MSYSDLLKDPRWQKKRLEVLERDEWKCRECGSAQKTLHVHHTYYAKNRKPWEYESASLMTLCVDCHTRTTAVAAELQSIIGKIPLYLNDIILGMVRYETAYHCGGDGRVRIENAEQLEGVAQACGIAEYDEVFSDIHNTRSITVQEISKRRVELDREALVVEEIIGG